MTMHYGWLCSECGVEQRGPDTPCERHPDVALLKRRIEFRMGFSEGWWDSGELVPVTEGVLT